MIARQEAVKVLYHAKNGELPDDIDPVAIILNGNGRTPTVYRIGRLDADELANLYESGDPDQETNLLAKGGRS